MAGLHLDDWQQWCLHEAMSEAYDGQWSAFEVAILVSRQNGKGSILEARQLAGLYLTHERLQVHTAHEFKTCFEHFLRVVHLIEATPDLDNKVMRIRRGAGEQAIELKTGERLRFLARSGGSGRGMSGDTVYLDEAFALTASIMGALLPTLSARPNPQLWYMSSAPKSTSEVLLNLRKRGHEGHSPRLFFADWGHPRGQDISDREAWYAANPAMGIRITEEFVEAEFEAMASMPDEFARERLGVPDPEAGEIDRIVSREAWAGTQDVEFPQPGRRALAWDVSPDGSWSSIAWVGERPDGVLHCEVVESAAGTAWVAERVARYVKGAGDLVAAVGYAAGTQAEALAVDVAAVVPLALTKVNGQSYAAGCGEWFNKTTDGTLRHTESALLTSAVDGAVWRNSGETRVFDRRNARAEITPLCAVVVAIRALDTTPVMVSAGYYSGDDEEV